MVEGTRSTRSLRSRSNIPTTPSAQISKPPTISQTAAPAFRNTRNIPDISELETPTHPNNNLLDSLVQTLKRKEQSLTTPRRPVQPHLFQFTTPIFSQKTPTGADEETDMNTPTKPPKSTVRKPLIPENEFPPSPLDSTTPSKVNHKPTAGGLFDFNFSSGLESAGEKVIAEMKEKARLKKEELKKGLAETGTSIWDSINGGAAKTAAAKETEATRYDGAHSKEFAKMDSIANHYSALRTKTSTSKTTSTTSVETTADAPASAVPTTPAKSLKRTKSVANLDTEAPDATPNRPTLQTPAVPPRTAAKRVKFSPDHPIPQTEAIPRMKTILHKPKPSRKSFAAQPSSRKGFTASEAMEPLGTPIGQDSPKITTAQTVGSDRFKGLGGKLFGGTANLFGFKRSASPEKKLEGLAETSETIPEMMELHTDHVKAAPKSRIPAPQAKVESIVHESAETDATTETENATVTDSEATPTAPPSKIGAPQRSIKQPVSRIPPPSSKAPISALQTLKRTTSTKSLLPKRSTSSSSLPVVQKEEVARKDEDFEFKVIKRLSMAPAPTEVEPEHEENTQEREPVAKPEPEHTEPEAPTEEDVNEKPQEMLEVNRKENVKRMVDYIQEARSRTASPVKQSAPTPHRRGESPTKPIEETVGSPFVKNKPGRNPFEIPKLQFYAKKGRESAAAYLAKESTPEDDEDNAVASDTETRTLFVAPVEEAREEESRDDEMGGQEEDDTPKMPGGFDEMEDVIEVKQSTKPAPQPQQPPTKKRVIRPLRPGAVMAGAKPHTTKPAAVSSSLLQPTAAALARAAAAKAAHNSTAAPTRPAKRKASPSAAPSAAPSRSISTTKRPVLKPTTAQKPAPEEDEESARSSKRTRLTTSTATNLATTAAAPSTKPSTTTSKAPSFSAPTAASSRSASTTSKTKVGGGTVKLDKPAGGLRGAARTTRKPTTGAKDKARWR